MTKSTTNKPASLTPPKSPEEETKAATTSVKEAKPVLLEAAEIASLKAQLSKKISEYNQLRGEKITEVDLLTRKLNTEISAHNRTERKLKERTSALFKADNLNKDMQAVNKRMKAKTEKAVKLQQEESERAQKMTRKYVAALDRGWYQKLRAERAERKLKTERSISVFLAFVGFVCLLFALWLYSKYHGLSEISDVDSLL